MYDNFAKIVLATEKLFSNPEQVVLRLLGERNSWPNSRMHEKEITADEIWPQTSQELAMASWKHPVKLRGEFALLTGVRIDLRREAIRQQGV